MKGFYPKNKKIDPPLQKSHEQRKKAFLRKNLHLDINELEKYTKLSKLNELNEQSELIERLKKNNISTGDVDVIKTSIPLALVSLQSKQCNEPYEMLLSETMGLTNLDEKHGWDAVDNKVKSREFYEYKPSSATFNPCGTINDDSIKKIKKCEDLGENTGWLTLGGIDKDNFTFNCIFKFPIEIYNEDRKTYLNNIIEKNKNKSTQTRSTYPINIKNSIELCLKYSKHYYIWER